MAIQCAICCRFISFQDFTEGRTVMVDTQPAFFMEPPEAAPAHRACVPDDCSWVELADVPAREGLERWTFGKSRRS